jgi:hypothetical protein
MASFAPNGTKLWSAAEDAIIREHYPAGGSRAVQERIGKGRGRSAIMHRARAIGVSSRPAWTPRADRRLTFLWGGPRISLGAIAKQLGHTPGSVYRRAVALGLGAGCPNGFEYLTSAARRTNFHVVSLRKILAWDRVRICLVRSDPSKKRETARRHFVDSEQVDRAIARWMTCETLSEASRSRGVHDETLRKYLVEDGVIEDRHGVPRTRWRIPSLEIDRVVAARRRDKAQAARSAS